MNEYEMFLMDNDDNEKLAYRICREHGTRCFRYASDRLKDNKDLVLSILKSEEVAKRKDALIYELISDRLRADYDIAILCVKYNGVNLRYAPEELRANRNIVSAAVRSCNSILWAATEDVKDDKDFISGLIRDKVSIRPEHISDRLKSDKDILRTVAEYLPSEIEYFYKGTSEEVKKDRDLLKLILSRNSGVMRYALPEYRDDRELAFICVRSRIQHFYFEYLSDRLKDDEELVLAVAESQYSQNEFLKQISERLQNDEIFVRKLVVLRPKAAEHIPEGLKNDRELALALAKKTYLTPFFMGDSIKDDDEVILECLKLNINAISYASIRIQENKDLIMDLLDRGLGLYDIRKSGLTDDVDVAFKAIRKNRFDYHYISPRLKNDPLLALAAINGFFPYMYYDRVDDVWEGTTEINLLKEIGEELRGNREFAMIILKGFTKTSFGEAISKRFDPERPSELYTIISEAVQSGPEYYCDKKPSEKLDFTEEIEKLCLERGVKNE